MSVVDPDSIMSVDTDSEYNSASGYGKVQILNVLAGGLLLK
jgi:hypothetical protein